MLASPAHASFFSQHSPRKIHAMAPNQVFPRTRGEQKALKKRGDIRGWFQLPRGRPPKEDKCIPLITKQSSDNATTTAALTNATTTAAESVKPSKKKREQLCYNDPAVKKELHRLVNAALRGEEVEAHETIIIPDRTLRRKVKEARERGLTGCLNDGCDDLYDEVTTNGKPSLYTTDEDREVLSNCIIARDKANNGMTRGEVIS